MQEKVSIMRHLAHMEISVTSGNCFTGTRQSLVRAKTVTLGEGYFDLNLVLMTETINLIEVCLRLEGVPKDDETAFTLSLVHHVMKELAVNQDYVIDSQCKGKQKKCPCGCEGENYWNLWRHQYGYGHVDTWHGTVDVLLGNQSVALEIYPLGRQTSDDDEEYESSDEDEDKLCALEVKEAKLKRFTNHLIAETIVFAFLQKRRCPEFKTFLIPTIGVLRKQLVFFFMIPKLTYFLKLVSSIFSIKLNQR